MNRVFKNLITSTSLCLLSTSAVAAYTGHFLVGIDGGFSMQNGTPYFLVHNYPVLFNQTTFPLNQDLDNDGGVVSGFAGYEVTDGTWFAGLEASFSWQDIGEDKTFSGTIPNITGPLNYTTNINYSRGLVVGVSGRFGVIAHPWVHPYVRLGVEGSKDKIFVNTFVTNLGNVPAFDDRQYNGRLVLGAGAEVPVHRNVSLRVEYSYSSSNGTFAHIMPNGATAGTSADLYHKPNQHLIKGAATWSFI